MSYSFALYGDRTPMEERLLLQKQFQCANLRPSARSNAGASVTVEATPPFRSSHTGIATECCDVGCCMMCISRPYMARSASGLRISSGGPSAMILPECRATM